MDRFKSERLPGIDVLRVILSFCVITIHILHYGGFRTHADPSAPVYYFLWFIAVALDCTVNCFAIMSGFLLYNKTFKCSTILHRFLTVLYHGLLIVVLFLIFDPDAVQKMHWLQAVLPVTYEEFWYFTAYVGMFFFAPLISKGMQALSRKQANMLICSLLLIFSVIPTVVGTDPFRLNYGHSAFWLLILFTIGAYLRKYHATFHIKARFLIGLFMGCVLITCLGMRLLLNYPFLDGMLWMEYTSPTIVLASIAVVLLFASMQVPDLIQRISVFLTGFTFSIYLLHEHPLIRQNLITDNFVSVLPLPGYFQIAAVLACTVIIWVTCLGLDCIRQLVFRILKVDVLLRKVDERLTLWSRETEKST